MKVGLLGAGRIGALHLNTLTRNELVTTVWVYDVDSSRSEALASQHGAGTATEVDSVLKWADAVVIATSTDTHADLLIAAAHAEVPAFCEKPIATDLASTDRAIDAINKAGIPVQIGFNRRFDFGFQAARSAVAQGRLGTLLSVVGHHHDHRPPPDDYIPVSGGGFKDQLIHDFDLLRFVTGDEAVAVHAAQTAIGLPVFADHGDYTTSIVTVWMASGSVACLVGARTDPVGYDVRMELFGTGDSIAVGLDRRTPLRSVEQDGLIPEEPYREWLERFGASFEAEMDAFLQVAQGTIPSPCTPADARAALVIAEAAKRSVRESSVVQIGEAA